MKQFLSFAVAIIMLLMQLGLAAAFAEQAPATPTEELPLTQTLPSGVLEDGTLDGDIVKQWVDAYLAENHWDSPGCQMAIGYWYSGDDEAWYYNADEWIGGVNWYKLPLCMYYAERLKRGEIAMDTIVTGITLEYAMTTTLENSSGPSIYSLVTDLAEKESKSYTDLGKQYADLPEDYYASEYYNNAYTARLMMEITKTLYHGGEERFPHILESMKKSQPEDLFKRDWNVRTAWECAQTHTADWGGEGDDLIHCTGILYTPTPVVLTVMTRNIWDLDIIGGVAGHFANLAVEMHNRQQAWGSVVSGTADTVEATPAGDATAGTESVSGNPERDNTAAMNEPVPADGGPDTDNMPLPTEAPAPNTAPTPAEAGQADARRNTPLHLIVLLLVLLLLIAAEAVFAVRRRRTK